MEALNQSKHETMSKLSEGEAPIIFSNLDAAKNETSEINNQHEGEALSNGKAIEDQNQDKNETILK